MQNVRIRYDQIIYNTFTEHSTFILFTLHWMQAQWPHGITTVSHGLIQQTGQFVDDAAAVVDTCTCCSRWLCSTGRRRRSSHRRILGLLTYRGYCNRAFGLSGNLLSGFWFIGDLVIGHLTYRGFVIGLMVIGLLAIGLMSHGDDIFVVQLMWKLRMSAIFSQLEINHSSLFNCRSAYELVNFI